MKLLHRRVSQRYKTACSYLYPPCMYIIINYTFNQCIANKNEKGSYLAKQVVEVYVLCVGSSSSVHLKEASRPISLMLGRELWFFALLSLLSSQTMKNSVCSRDGGGADTANDTGEKEGKKSQLSSIREKKNESD